ncbi:MAG: hypothetical protein UV64_C0007G0002 [Parcubacteria group bacterium GW2011_GWC1_43_11b]|nr:MAG: hypothetical protein UV64_C0007G0002 [Parcubacteria group bacterium GW2011_GWC1_43_11b]
MSAKNWRPKNWPKNPCDSCDHKEEDSYGMICNWSCGQATAQANFEAGAQKMYDEIRKLFASRATAEEFLEFFGGKNE